jgi:hypothetical protein
MISHGPNGTPYDENELIKEEHCLSDAGIHHIIFYDDYGDGFCCRVSPRSVHTTHRQQDDPNMSF